MTKFSPEQQKFISGGARNTLKLQQLVKHSLGLTKQEIESKRHVYIFSPPGAGKTFTVQSIADAANVNLVKIQGAASLNAFVVQLATAAYAHMQGLICCPSGLTVWIDDCDSLFMEADALNLMKGALDQERNVLSYNKNFTIMIKNYLSSTSSNDKFIGDALQYFQKAGSVGIEIPTDNMRFIITSNRQLTAPSEELNTAKKMHSAAIRDRVSYKAFDLKRNEQWGWIASIAMSVDVYKLSAAKKTELLVWMYDNWDNLPATSMRAVKELAAMMVNNKAEYISDWEMYLN
jgi:hypothetical protein